MEGDKKNVGAPVPDEALGKVAGGEGGTSDPCPNCGSIERPSRKPWGVYICPGCNKPRTVSAGQQGIA